MSESLPQSPSLQNPADQPNSTDKVPMHSKIVYGLGTGLDMWGHWLYPGVAYAVFMSYLGVRPAWVGTALMLNRLLDAFSDPFFGWLSDNTRTRWGRRRPFLLFGGLAAGLGLPLLFLFIVPHWSERQIFAYMLASSILYVPLMSSFNMAFQSLGAEMTPDYNERNSVMSFKGAIQKIMEVGNFAGLQVATWAGLRFATATGHAVDYTRLLSPLDQFVATVRAFARRRTASIRAISSGKLSGLVM